MCHAVLYCEGVIVFMCHTVLLLHMCDCVLCSKQVLVCDVLYSCDCRWVSCCTAVVTCHTVFYVVQV